jgi:hypothetical protein
MFSNRWLVAATFISMAAMQLVIWTPKLDDIFHTNALAMRWFEWLLCIAATSITLILDEGYKAYLKHQFNKKRAEQQQTLHDDMRKNSGDADADDAAAGSHKITIEEYGKNANLYDKDADTDKDASSGIHVKSPSFNTESGSLRFNGTSSSSVSKDGRSPAPTSTNTLLLPGQQRLSRASTQQDTSPQPLELSSDSQNQQQ